VNPIEGNSYATTRHLVAAYQCVMAGDRARTHRHSAAALRLVLQGKTGVYTVVNGARIDMHPGDVLLTPSWCWHGHANETGETGYWLDFLDIPFIQMTEAMFFEPYPQGGLEAVTSTGPTPMRIPSGETPKTTTNSIYAVVSGRARFLVEGETDETLGVGDVIAVPCWHTHTIEAPGNTVVFKVSDEPIFAKLGLSRTAN
jgi:gentisate 1,2-dioxygenase